MMLPRLEPTADLLGKLERDLDASLPLDRLLLFYLT